MGASSRSPSPMTMVPRIGTESMVLRMDSVATRSECLRSPIPMVCAQAIAASSTTRKNPRESSCSTIRVLYSSVMSEVLQSPIESYINGLLPARDEVLVEMEAYAAENKVPIIGPACGGLLHQLALMIGAKRIFEMGSAIGYSTIWWARALGDGGEVYYTDGSQENFDRAKQ